MSLPGLAQWPLRVKVMALLGAASLLPLGVGAVADIREARQQLIENAEALLTARGDQLARELDTFHAGYQRSAARFARIPEVLAFCGATGAEVERRRSSLQAVLEVLPADDPNLRGAAIFDRLGVVEIATEPALVGTHHSNSLAFKQALLGAAVVSDVHLSRPEAGNVPTITYLHPVSGLDGSPLCFVALWVRAAALWQIARSSNELAGRGSFAVLYDQNGVRVAHTSVEQIVFHPGGELPAPVLEAQVAERRFGDKTRQWLSEVWPAPEQFERARANAPGAGVFRGYAPGTRSWTFSVARRLRSVRWTVFYVLPEQTLEARLAATTRRNAAFAGVIMVLALSVGATFGTVMLRPIGALSRAAERFGHGELGTRVPPIARADELGRLVRTFNAMAASLQAQSTALHAARANLEAQVEQRTASLAETAAALAASEEDLRVTLHSIADAVIATDLSGRVRRMNAAAEGLTGWDFDSARDQPLAQVFTVLDEKTHAPLESPVERVLREGAIASLAPSILLIAGDGTETAVAASGAPIRDAGGKARGVVLVFRDQTPQRLAARALEASETRFRRLADAGLLGIVQSDDAGRLLDANQAFLSMIGYSREELLSGKLSGAALDIAESTRANAPARDQLSAQGAARPWEKELIHKDGHQVPVLVAAATLGPGELVWCVLDLTERRRAEHAARQSEAQKAAVIEASLDAIVLMDHEGKILEFNPAAERTFGYSRAEVLGRPLAEVIIPPAARERHRAGLQRYLVTGEAHVIGRRVEMSGLRRDGSEFPAELAIVVLRSAGPPIFTGYIRDITERREAAEAASARRAKEAAEAANKELEAFSYSVSHDLRAPLRAIDGFSQAVLEDSAPRLDEEGKQRLVRIRAGAQRMGALIDDLLKLSGVTRSELRLTRVDLSKLAQEVADELRARDPDRKAEILVEPGLTAEGDPQLLRVVLDNLLGNAWKFTERRPVARIEVGRAASPPGRSTFFVRDNGAGFDMRYASKLFGAFQRLHSATEFPGTGIGLATVARVIRRHGGTAWAEGAVDHGATIYFTLQPA